MNVINSLPRRRRFGILFIALVSSAQLFAQTGTTNLGPLNIIRTNNALAFAWSGGPDIRLQSLSNANSTIWTNEPGTVGRNSATKQIGATSGLFRLFKP